MVDLKSIIDNPLSNEETINGLIDAYIEGGEYWQFLTREKRAKDTTFADQYYIDYLNSMIFNNFRKNYLDGSYFNLTKEEFEEARENMLEKRFTTKDFFYYMTIRGYLREIGELSNTQEVEKAINIENDYLYNKYFKDILSKEQVKERLKEVYLKDNNWRIINSKTETGKNNRIEELNDIKHRLYLNLSNEDIHRMATLFINECREKGIPYYFKIALNTSRDDSIIIYSSDELLESYIIILNEIVKKHPGIEYNSFNPPLLTGKINNWIGYGEEPANTIDSYNESRYFPIIFAIKKTYKDWLNRYKDEKIIALPDESGRILTPLEYISMKASESYNKQNNTTNNEEQLKEAIKITEQLYQGQNIEENNENYQLSKFCEKGLRYFIKYIKELDKNFISQLVFNIEESMSKEGINKDNLCFNEEKPIRIVEEKEEKGPLKYLKRKLKIKVR